MQKSVESDYGQPKPDKRETGSLCSVSSLLNLLLRLVGQQSTIIFRTLTNSVLTDFGLMFPTPLTV